MSRPARDGGDLVIVPVCAAHAEPPPPASEARAWIFSAVALALVTAGAVRALRALGSVEVLSPRTHVPAIDRPTAEGTRCATCGRAGVTSARYHICGRCNHPFCHDATCGRYAHPYITSCGTPSRCVCRVCADS
jgi:hypothetical protein